MFSQFQQKIPQVQFYFLMLLAFSLPLSTSLLSVTALLVALLWFIEGRYREKLGEMLTNPVCLAVLAYLALLFFGLMWSDDLSAGFSTIEKHWKIMLMPLFLTGVCFDKRKWYAAAFIAGVTVAMIMTYLAWFGLLQYGDVNPEHLTRRTFHVVYNPLLAFAVYLLLHAFFWGGTRGNSRWVTLALACCMIFNMFITEGRAGQLAFFVLLIVLLLQVFRKNMIKAVCIAIFFVPVFFMVGYKASPTFSNRIDQARLEIAQFEQNPETSVGLRLLYWQNSLQIISKSPWLGVGTGGFVSAYEEVNSQLTPEIAPTDNPHNQYLYTGCQFGLFGMVVLLALFFLQAQQAALKKDGWERLYVAFPVFFLTIMLTETYLVVYETGFLFSLFSAVLYKYSPAEQEKRARHRAVIAGKKYWLILSYRANIPGSACSQHLDDRLPYLERAGITPILLTGPVGKRYTNYCHVRTFSLAPSGIRFELRHFLRKKFPNRWQFKLVETVLLLPVYPFYLIEKIVINLESEWSWFFFASLRGAILRWRYKPEVMYSTGGSASAHMAALIIRRFFPLTWLAETQDPLIHDHGWQRSRLVFKLYQWLEKRISARCDGFIFLTHQAKHNAKQRVGTTFPGVVIYPGASPEFFSGPEYSQEKKCHFAHFGSLAGSRNLLVLLQAFQSLFQEQPEYRPMVQVDLYGSLDGESDKLMQQLHLADLVAHHGLVHRSQAIHAMQKAGCLLLIQNTTFFSTETIPSKVYEYLFSNRPMLALIHQNVELSAMLAEKHHFIAAADDVNEVKSNLRSILELYATTSFASATAPVHYTVENAVENLISLAYGQQVCQADGVVDFFEASQGPGPSHDAELAESFGCD